MSTVIRNLILCGGIDLARQTESMLEKTSKNGDEFIPWLTNTVAIPKQGSLNTEFWLAKYITEDPATLAMLDKVRLLADYPFPVLIQGETGTGKELIAKALHGFRVNKNAKSFIAVNCTALPADLIESELFGHERGAFTGAIQQRTGKFGLAYNGTLFLDEIRDMPMEAQAKLLRVLNDGTYTPLGGDTQLTTTARIVSATNYSLKSLVGIKQFRLDLLKRIDTFVIKTIPLRDRLCDLKPIANAYLGKAEADKLPYNLLEQRKYEGNVREYLSLLDVWRVFKQLPEDINYTTT